MRRKYVSAVPFLTGICFQFPNHDPPILLAKNYYREKKIKLKNCNSSNDFVDVFCIDKEASIEFVWYDDEGHLFSLHNIWFH